MAWYKNRRHRLLVERGEAVARAYESWSGMRRRVRHADPKRKEACYAGVRVDPRWEDFATFLADMGSPRAGQSIDRIDSRGDYTPNNCRWADATTQSRNRSYCRLTPEKAGEVRRLYAQGRSQQAIADLIGCSQVAISKVVRGVNWA